MRYCLSTFCSYSINVRGSTWKCVTLVKKNVLVKILQANIWAKKAVFVRNYFSRCNNFHLKGSQLPSLSRSAIFDQINADILYKRVNYWYLATFTCPIVFLCPVSTWTAVNGLWKCSLKSTKVNTWSNFDNIGRRQGRSLLMVRS